MFQYCFRFKISREDEINLQVNLQGYKRSKQIFTPKRYMETKKRKNPFQAMTSARAIAGSFSDEEATNKKSSQ
ncbi:CLUMA_CG014676, isoform A [Clunio marinus]|uniref:CLUMA_CG014676, isoform A n=1 Tax=Clunio marinus TaxID=568069 RepID=A0A1J1INR5_9DIPT|nr:CLUMA_CG014676, isoform A [Clunio marinus]